jgi:DNA-binding NarL/FixJ family response regulator
MGYLVKGESMDKILSSIRDVYNGGAPMSFSIARKVLSHFERKLPEIKGFDELTERERKCWNFYLRDCSTKKSLIKNSSALIP